MLDRYILGFLVDDIKLDLGFSDTQMGWLGTAFTLLYAFAAIPFGIMADRAKRVWIIAFGILIWSLATMATALMTTFALFFIARLFVGFGEAVLSPSAFSIIGDSFPKEKRAKPIAVYSVALVLASTITSYTIAVVLWAFNGQESIFVPVLGELMSWQFIMIGVGAPGLIVALVFFLLKEPPRTESALKDPGALTEAFDYAKKRWVTFFCFFTIFACMLSIAYAQFNWLPTMFERVYGLEEWSRGQYAVRNGTATLFIGVSTYFLSGIISDAWSAKGRKDAPLILAIIGLFIMVPSTAIAPLMPTGWGAFILLMVSTVGIGMTSCTGVTALLQIVPGHIRGSIVSYYYLFITLLGGMTSPLVVGFMSSSIFGEDKLNLAMSVQPLLYGIPVIMLLPWTLKFYREELAKIEVDGA